METQKINGVHVVTDESGAPLVCYGCGHSAGSKPYPSYPSGERPCLFCIRNPKQAEQLKEVRGRFDDSPHPFTARYDNGPTREEVGDQYISTDRITRDLPKGTMVIT